MDTTSILIAVIGSGFLTAATQKTFDLLAGRTKRERELRRQVNAHAEALLDHREYIVTIRTGSIDRNVDTTWWPDLPKLPDP